MSKNGQFGTQQDPLQFARAANGYLSLTKQTSDPPAAARRVWLRVDQNELRYYDAGQNLKKVPLKTSQPSSPYLTVTDGNTTYYINLESKSSADHPNLAVDGAIGDGLAVTGTTIQSIDNFNDGDLSEYETRRSDPESSMGTSTTAYEGSHAAVSSGDTNNTSAVSDPGEGLDNYPARGDAFTIRVRMDDPGDVLPAVHFFGNGNYQNNTNWRPVGYEVQLLSRGSDSLELVRVDADGTVTTLDSTTVDWSQYGSEWLWVKVADSSDTITATVEDQARTTQLGQVSATDSTYSGSSFGLAAFHETNVDGQARFDIAELV